MPIDRFFVRNHTSTPIIDPQAWRLEVTGAGLRGGPAGFSLDDLRLLPATTRSVTVECAGNGRSYFGSQQGQTVSGTAWGLGAVGVARWRGVRLSTVLWLAGLGRRAVDVQATGLDPNYVTGGVDLGPVRRPMPLRKAPDDVLLAYEMNGEPLPPDHGAPVRLIVPSWVGIASIEWVGRIGVSDVPLLCSMATLERRGNSVRVSWRLGGARDGSRQSCTSNGPADARLKPAQAAKELVEARGHNITRSECYAAILGDGSDTVVVVPTFRAWAEM